MTWPARRSKYNARKTVVEGRTFHSRKEAERYLVLREEQRQGAIHALKCQVRYPLRVGADLITTYIADFVYVRKGQIIVEDVKGCVTALYLIKKRLLKVLYGIEVLET